MLNTTSRRFEMSLTGISARRRRDPGAWRIGVRCCAGALGLALVPLAWPGSAQAQIYDAPFNLVAQKDGVVAAVEVCNDDSDLHVTYVADEGWCLSQTSVEASDEPSAIPQAWRGKPLSSRFAYWASHRKRVDSYAIQTVLDAWGQDTELLVATNARDREESATAEESETTETAWDSAAGGTDEESGPPPTDEESAPGETDGESKKAKVTKETKKAKETKKTRKTEETKKSKETKNSKDTKKSKENGKSNHSKHSGLPREAFGVGTPFPQAKGTSYLI